MLLLGIGFSLGLCAGLALAAFVNAADNDTEDVLDLVAEALKRDKPRDEQP